MKVSGMENRGNPGATKRGSMGISATWVNPLIVRGGSPA
jgi:hypothetical protein